MIRDLLIGGAGLLFGIILAFGIASLTGYFDRRKHNPDWDVNAPRVRTIIRRPSDDNFIASHGELVGMGEAPRGPRQWRGRV